MKIKAAKTTRVDYLGVFQEGTETELQDYDIEWFERSAGVPLTQDALPEGVELLDTERSAPADNKAKNDPDFPHKEA